MISHIFHEDRLKSLAWRASAMALAAFTGYIATSIESMQIPGGWVVVAGLVLGEVSKGLNNWVSGRSSLR